MDEEQEAIYQQGYRAFLDGRSELSNPYSGLDAEYWSDGYADAEDDQ